jgi:iron-sulfur cluster repair protein YtfE (RIC family)
MNQMETGLRHRLRRAARQMTTQHEHLRALHAALVQSLENERIGEVREGVERLRSAVEAHFSLEDGVFFPAVHGLHPESARELRGFVREHEDFLRELAALSDMLATGTLDAFAQRYRDFCESVAGHEAREERLAASLAHLFDATG